jgi:hypothetical protein
MSRRATRRWCARRAAETSSGGRGARGTIQGGHRPARHRRTAVISRGGGVGGDRGLLAAGVNGLVLEQGPDQVIGVRVGNGTSPVILGG